MAAFKSTTPLQETTRANIRWTKTPDSEVYMMKKRPLSVNEIDTSPAQKSNTFLLVEPTLSDTRISNLEKQVNDLRKEVDGLQKEVDGLKAAKEQANDDLYKPIFSSRELAIVSLLKSQKERIDSIVESIIHAKAQKIGRELATTAERSAARKAYIDQFQNMSYYQLSKAHSYSFNQAFFEVLTATEHEFLQHYIYEGFKPTHCIDVIKSMRSLHYVKRNRDRVTAHIFDYDYMEKGREAMEDQRRAWKLQAMVLMDLQKAMKAGWLRGDFSMLGGSSGTLQLEVSKTSTELERKTRFSLAEFAEME